MDAFIGEIRAFPYSFPPAGWVYCNGQSLPLQNYTALYAVLGGRYGTDQKTYFNVPNLQGMTVMGQGQGPGLSNRTLAKTVGSPTVTLAPAQLAPHTHTLNGSFQNDGAIPLTAGPAANSSWFTFPQVTVAGQNAVSNSYLATQADVQMDPKAVGAAGGSNGITQSHDNQQPYLVFAWCICTEGAFPSVD